jgi:hypothetical protein
VADLHPELVAGNGPGPRPFTQSILAAVTVDDDVAGPFQEPSVDHHVAGDQQAGAASRPALIQLYVGRRGAIVRVRQAFGHRRLGDAVGKRDATAQAQFVRERTLHGTSGASR